MLLAVRRPPEEQGLYYVLTNALALTGLFELGLGTVLVQFASHAAAGLVRRRDGEFVPGAQSTDAIQSLMRLTVRWYFYAAWTVIVALLIAGTLLARRDGSVATAQFVAAGLTVALGIATYVSAWPITIILEGTGISLPCSECGWCRHSPGSGWFGSSCTSECPGGRCGTRGYPGRRGDRFLDEISTGTRQADSPLDPNQAVENSDRGHVRSDSDPSAVEVGSPDHCESSR